MQQELPSSSSSVCTKIESLGELFRVRGFHAKTPMFFLMRKTHLSARAASLLAPCRSFPTFVGVARERGETDPLSRTLTAVHVRPFVRELGVSHAATSPTGWIEIQLLKTTQVRLTACRVWETRPIKTPLFLCRNDGNRLCRSVTDTRLTCRQNCQFPLEGTIKYPKTGAVRKGGHVPPVTNRSAVRKSRGSLSRISVSGVRRSQENAISHGDAILADFDDRMLTARSGPLGLGVPRTLGPAEGSDHLFLLPERALGMDSTHLRQDLAGLDFNLHLNLLHTAPRGNVWLCELSRKRTILNDNFTVNEDILAHEDFIKKSWLYLSHITLTLSPRTFNSTAKIYEIIRDVFSFGAPRVPSDYSESRLVPRSRLMGCGLDAVCDKQRKCVTEKHSPIKIPDTFVAIYRLITWTVVENEKTHTSKEYSPAFMRLLEFAAIRRANNTLLYGGYGVRWIYVRVSLYDRKIPLPGRWYCPFSDQFLNGNSMVWLNTSHDSTNVRFKLMNLTFRGLADFLCARQILISKGHIRKFVAPYRVIVSGYLTQTHASFDPISEKVLNSYLKFGHLIREYPVELKTDYERCCIYHFMVDTLAKSFFPLNACKSNRPGFLCSQSTNSRYHILSSDSICNEARKSNANDYYDDLSGLQDRSHIDLINQFIRSTVMFPLKSAKLSSSSLCALCYIASTDLELGISFLPSPLLSWMVFVEWAMCMPHSHFLNVIPIFLVDQHFLINNRYYEFYDFALSVEKNFEVMSGDIFLLTTFRNFDRKLIREWIPSALFSVSVSYTGFERHPTKMVLHSAVKVEEYLYLDSNKRYILRRQIQISHRKFKHILRYSNFSCCDPPRDCLTLHGTRFARRSSIGIIQVFSIPTLSSDKRQCEAPYRRIPREAAELPNFLRGDVCLSVKSPVNREHQVRVVRAAECFVVSNALLCAPCGMQRGLLATKPSCRTRIARVSSRDIAPTVSTCVDTDGEDPDDMGAGKMNREIPSSTLATLRGILVSSLSRENLGPHDLPVHEHTRHRSARKVHFHEGKPEVETILR
ncbi:hypothetical protein G5I_06441 [Acromyrmex echinatior]|uniref:Uncharacterized protein n=1 Tax=Acromyrmex echinatior TaxID=103372 RepID=F4WL18_ACREC|nr:hypothetical protein G5I_06441 [Acromyrmex echinatior]